MAVARWLPGADDGAAADRKVGRADLVARRRLLYLAGIVAAGAALGRPEPGAAAGAGGAGGTHDVAAAVPEPLTEPQVTMVLQVARVGATYPVPFPAFGEPGPATSRVTRGRLTARLAETPTQRLEQVRLGADSLIAANLLGATRDQLLDGVGRIVAAAPRPAPQLVATVALAAAVVTRTLPPGGAGDGPAAVWLHAVRRRYARMERERRQPRRKGDR